MKPFGQQTFYLASSSPRRQELLTQLNIEFDVLVPDIDETCHDNESPHDYVLRMAVEKAQAAQIKWKVSDVKPYRPILAADTTVVANVDGKDVILSKPESEEHSVSMLTALSGQTHAVYSAIALWYQKDGEDAKIATATSLTQVTFGHINEQEMHDYWLSKEPLGKAGGYAIQGLGAQFVEKIEGSYTGVVGLPLYELKQLIAQNL